MRKFYLLTFFIFYIQFFSQTVKTDSISSFPTGMVEDASGKMITDNAGKKKYLLERQAKILRERQRMMKVSQNAVEMCTNGGFEQFETVSGSVYMKNFLYNIGDPPGPTQCQSLTISGNTYIPQYNPNNMSVMATSVPANHIDKYMGDIKAFDQYALKINYTDSNTYGSIVQGKRYKTNNENFLKFNYKAVLQSVYDTSHKDNQAFFKARILNKNNKVVSEFCLVGDEKNCIFTKVSDGSISYVTLYTANWQSGILDISSIPNNEEFTVEFMASRCGLGGHFGYAYIDDICTLHSTESFVGSVDLNPLFAICPTLPLNVCGSYSLPNSGGIVAVLKKLTLNLYDEQGKIIHTTSTTSSLDTTNKKFCFTLPSTVFPNTNTANYNVGVIADFDVSGTSTTCGSTNINIFGSASDPDANDGWDISFLNCVSSCNIDVKTAKISKCDTDHNGSEIFDLSLFETQVVNSTLGLTFDYFADYSSAFNNTNKIANYTQYSSPSATLYIRISKDASCYKIIPVNVEVKNPTASISGILNVCSGSTVLTASSGSTYLWNTGETTPSITVTNIGTYSVTVTDSFGCSSTASVNIEPSQTAVTPTLEVTQPSCFVAYGTIKVTSPASEYSFDNGKTWTTNLVIKNLSPGDYSVMIKTVKGCISYPQNVTITAALTSYPYYTSDDPKFCGDTGTIKITSLSAYYSFDNGATWVTNPILTNVSPGSYTIRTKDNAGCISNPVVVKISSNTLDTPDFTVVDPACTKTGSITINTPSDFYTFDGGTTWVTNNVLSNISSGNFSIGIKNKLGCTSYFANAYITNFQNKSPQYDVIPPTCGGKGTIYIKTEAAEYSFDNGKTWTTSNMADFPAGIYYIKIKNSDGCVSLASTVYLNEPYLPYPIVTVVQPTCGQDGSVTINSISDYYSFDDGKTWTTTNTKTLPVGTYFIKVKNKEGCISSSSYVTLNEARLPVPDVTLTQPTCTTKGSITITTPASFYSIDGGQTWSTSNVFNNLTNSGYPVSIKNNQGCKSDYRYVYFSTAYLPEPIFTAVSPSCGNIGSIKFTSTADYYSIDGGYTWSTNPVFNNLPKGYYNIVVKNNAGCSSNYYQVYLTDTNLANPNYTAIQPSCGTKGSITINTVADSYSIDGGYTWSTTNVFNNLNPGYYDVRIKNSSGCSSLYCGVRLLTYYLPDPTFTYTQPSCGVGGTITITTSSDQYSIDGGKTWSTSPNFTDLKPGYYYLMVKNAQGCASPNNYTYVSLATPYIPRPDVLVTQPTCETKGSIKIMTSASQYSFDGGTTWSTNNELTNITSGYYYIVIKNAQGCISNSFSVNIEKYYLPRPFIKTVQPTCGNDGSITVVSQAASYSFDNGATWVTSPVLLNPKPGYYYILVKNSAGCVSESSYVYIYQYFLSSPSTTSIQPTCDVPSGTIIVKTVADQYSFDNGKTWTTNPVKDKLTSGSYNVLIKNSKGCVSQSSYVYIYSPPTVPAAPVATVVQPSACGATDGSITITSSGSSFTFNDGASWSPNKTKVNIGAGTYIIRTRNGSGYCDSAPLLVTLNSGANIPAPAITVLQPTCSVSTGEITVTTSAANYSFDDGLTWQYSNTKSGFAPGSYKVKIKNSSGCISDVVVATVNNPAPLPAPVFTISQPDCGNLLGTIKVTTAAAEFSFDNGITFGASSTKTNAAPGTYNIIVKDSAGCISLVGTATVNPPPVIPSAPQISVVQPTGCTSSSGNVSVISAAAFYSFDDGATWVSNASANLSSGSYKVRIKMSSSGCPSDATVATINPPQNAPSIPTYTVTQPTSCVNPFGSISVTSSASSYSFDNGANYTSNAGSGQLAPGIYYLKIKNSAGCESGSVAVTINKPTDFPPIPTTKVQQIDCSHPKAEIIVNETASQYSIDGGTTWQNSNVFNGLSPKTYTVLLKNSAGCVSEATTVTINTFTSPTPKPTSTAIQSFCIQQNATIADIQIAGNNVTWYDALTGGNILPSNTILADGKNYFASQNIGGCESERTQVKIGITNISAPTGNSPQGFCISQNAKVSDLLVNGKNIIWYTSATGNVQVSPTTILQDGVTYYASQKDLGCESSVRLPVLVSLVTTNISAKDYSEIFCSDQNGSKTVNLSNYLSNVVANPGNYSFKFYDKNAALITNFSNYPLASGKNTISVEINSGNGCSAKAKLDFVLNLSPDLKIPATAEFCPGESVVLDAGSGFSDYEWMFNGKIFSTNQKISANQSGTYQITVKNTAGCTTTKSLVVSSITLPIIYDIKIVNQTIQIIASGSGNLEYSIDGIHWQNSPTFYNVANGTHTAYVRNSANPCALATKEFSIFQIPNAFSPNGDGINDVWKIDGLENYPGSKVMVYDRYGKMVLNITVNGIVCWNGEYLGRKLSTGNYWYHIIVSDGREFTGYVMMKIRE